MAKSPRERAMPSTPQGRPPAPPPPAASADRASNPPVSRARPTRVVPVEPAYLIAGTGASLGTCAARSSTRGGWGPYRAGSALGSASG